MTLFEMGAIVLRKNIPEVVRAVLQWCHADGGMFLQKNL
jgi:hypothetical protein